MEPARQVLDAAGRLQGQARELQGEITGQLLLGTVADPEALRLGSLLHGLVEALPLLDIKTRQGWAEELRAQVAAGGLQGAFYIGAHMPRDLGALVLQTLHYRVAAPPALRERVLQSGWKDRSEEHTSELQSPCNLVCRLLLEKKIKAEHINPSSLH